MARHGSMIESLLIRVSLSMIECICYSADEAEAPTEATRSQTHGSLSLYFTSTSSKIHSLVGLNLLFRLVRSQLPSICHEMPHSFIDLIGPQSRGA